MMLAILPSNPLAELQNILTAIQLAIQPCNRPFRQLSLPPAGRKTIHPHRMPSTHKSSKEASLLPETRTMLPESPPSTRSARVIAVMNNKGGVGKTTTVTNLAHAFAILGKRVLVVDNDGQHNTTSILLGQELPEVTRGMAELYLDSEHRPLSDFIIPTTVEGVDLIPATKELKNIDLPLIRSVRGQYMDILVRLLRYKLSPEALQGYDLVLIDCAPEWSLKARNAVAAAHDILIPVMYGSFELTGIGHLIEDLNDFIAKEVLDVRIAGIVPIKVDHRINDTIYWLDELKTAWPQYITPQIRYNADLMKSQRRWATIFQTHPNSKCAEDYIGLALYLSDRIAR